MASYILGTRQGTTTTHSYSFADVLMVHYLMNRGAEYLGTKTSEATMAKALGSIERAAGLLVVFGLGDSAIVANRIGTHIWPETSVRQAFHNSAVAGASDLNNILDKFENGTYKTAKIKLTYREVYNLNSKATVLTIIDSAKVV